MSVDENRAAFLRFNHEAVTNCELDLVDELVDPEIVHHSAFPGQRPGLDGIKESIRTIHLALSDYSVTVNDIVAEDDKVAGRCTINGTHLGELLGMAPTGKSFSMEEMMIVRFRNGRIIELWSIQDMVSLRQQLGLLPA